MATNDEGDGIARAALRVVGIVVALVAALMVWYAISALAGPAEGSLDAVLQGAVSSLVALVALAVLVVYVAGEVWVARSRSDGSVGRALRARPLLALEAATALCVVVAWPALGALGGSGQLDTGTLEALGWLGAAVAWALCAAVVARSGRALLRQFGGAGTTG